MLPSQVVERVRDEMGDWRGTGMAAMEMSHRSPEFMSIASGAEQNLRDLLAIPDHYRVLFMQGGASAQSAFVPLNLCASDERADFLVTGYWSRKTAKEAARFCAANVALDTAGNNDTGIPAATEWTLSDKSAFLHYADNETIGGVKFREPPQGNGPLVADMSSSILSEPVDVERFGVIYAGAQKNIGPAGLTVVIVRDDLLERSGQLVPAVFDYRKVAAAGSMLNTPPSFAWYVAGHVFRWVLEQGGVAAMAARNTAKAARLYAAIDNSDFYSNPVVLDSRSVMNVPFVLARPELDAEFLSLANERGLVSLKGHRSVGGMRASIYNSMPDEGVDALIEFMNEFEKEKA